MEEAALGPSLALQTSPPSIKVNPPESLTGMQPPVARPTSSGARGSLAPSSFYCPISMELMGDPCMLATGHTYERVRAHPLSTHILSKSPCGMITSLAVDVFALDRQTAHKPWSCLPCTVADR